MKSAGAAAVGLALALLAVRAAPASLAAEPIEALLQRAFDRSLGAPGVRSVTLQVHRDGRLVARRSFDVAHRRERERVLSLVRFTAPGYLRGNALLAVEHPGGSKDTWLYQADERRPRRVSTAHRADSFYGSDLSFEDFEHLRAERFALLQRPDRDEAGLPCAVLEAVPRGDSQYGRMVVWIERTRAAVVRIDFHRGDETSPMKRLRIELDGVTEEAGYLRIRRMRVEQIGRDAFTDVVIERLEIDPALPATLFSARALEREAVDLYSFVGRGNTPREPR